MATLKTQPNDASVDAFIESIVDDRQRSESSDLLRLMQEVTGESPKMWGDSIIGFGCYHYRYASGREGDWFVTGFSPRKGKFSIYLMSGYDQFGELLQQLGKHKTSKACLYITRLSDIDLNVLRKLIRESYDYMIKKYNS